MILGSLISVFGKEKLHSVFSSMGNKNLGVLGVIPAALIGIASPICMYGTIPISASFAEKGMRQDWLAAFMMSSILLNPQVLFYSIALGPEALVIRLVSCFLCGIAAGLLVRYFFRDKAFFNFTKFATDSENTAAPDSGKLCSQTTAPAPSPQHPALIFLKSLARNMKITGPALLIGIILSTLFQRYVPPDAVASLFGRHRGFGILMGASIGVPLFVCGGGSIPLLIAWMHSGMSLGSAAAFMITGPAMKITNLSAVKVILRAKNFTFYIIFATAFALLTGFFVDFVLLH